MDARDRGDTGGEEDGECSMTIELPLPARGLHPNARVHWKAKARAVKKARADAGLVGKLHRPKSCPWAEAVLHATYHFDKKRTRDDDGLVGWLKSYRDGLQDAGIVRDDSRIRMGNVTEVIGMERKVILRIEKLD